MFGFKVLMLLLLGINYGYIPKAYAKESSTNSFLEGSNNAEVADKTLESPVNNTLREAVVPCVIGYYYDGKACTKCHFSCDKCSGLNKEDCIEIEGKLQNLNGAEAGARKLKHLRRLQKINMHIERDDNSTDDSATNDPVIRTESFFNKTFSVNSYIFSRIVGVVALAHNVIQPDNPGPLMSIMLSKLCIRIIMIKLKYPWHVAQVFESEEYRSSAILLDFGFIIDNSMFHDVVDHYNSDEENHDMNQDSRYLINNWRNAFTIFVTLTMILLISLLKRLFKNFPKINYLLFPLNLLFNWNIFFIVFMSSIQESVYYALIDIQSWELETIMDYVSLLLSAATIISVLYLFSTIYKIGKENMRKFNPISGSNASVTMSKWRKVPILFKGFKRNSLLNQCLLIIVIMRVIIFDLTILYMSSFPTMQITINALYTGFIAVYVIFKKPFVRRPNYIQGSIFQTLTVLSMIGMFAIDIVDHMHIDAHSALVFKEIAGYYILLVLLLLTVSLKLSIILGLFLAICNYFKEGSSKQQLPISDDPMEAVEQNSVNNENNEMNISTGTAAKQKATESNSWKNVRVMENNGQESDRKNREHEEIGKGKTKVVGKTPYYQQQDD